MNNFTEIVKTKFLKVVKDNNMLDSAEEIVVGFSGGADSVCLLHLLHSYKLEFNYTLKAVHVNHGIRGDEADSDAAFAEDFCKSYGIPFELVKVDCNSAAKASKESIEECGRRLRYESFSKACGENSKIATAHNANDNAETIIFNITRGSTVKGLCGIPFVRDNIIRPILLCSRNEIEGYCNENSLTYVTDSTNESLKYTRNKIRHQVLPVLESINPSYLDAFSSLSANAKSTVDCISNSVECLLKECAVKPYEYDRNVLLKADRALVSELLHSEFFAFSGISAEGKKINDLIYVLKNGGRYQIYGGYFAEAKKDCFRLYKSVCNATEEINIDALPFKYLFGDFSVELENFSDNSKIIHQINTADVIDCNLLCGRLVLRSRRAGDSFTFAKRNVTKSLKKLFNEENVPIEKRDSMPVLADEQGVVWVQGVGVTKRCRASDESDNIIVVRGNYNDR